MMALVVPWPAMSRSRSALSSPSTSPGMGWVGRFRPITRLINGSVTAIRLLKAVALLVPQGNAGQKVVRSLVSNGS